MSIDPVDEKRKTLSIVPHLKKSDRHKVSRSSVPSSSTKAALLKNRHLVDKVKDIEFFREDRIKDAKLKLYSRSYESSNILDSLADKLIKVLK